MNKKIDCSVKEMAASIIKESLAGKILISDITLSKFKKYTQKERGFINELVYGTIRNLRYVDFWIAKAFNKNIQKIDVSVLSIIRLSVYQMLMMDNRKEWSVVFEACELVKTIKRDKAVGFINFILREILRLEPSTEKLKQYCKDEREFLSTNYSVPEWIYDMLLTLYGKENIESVLAAIQIPIGTTVRVAGNSERVKEIASLFNDKNVESFISEKTPYAIYTSKTLNYDMVKLLFDVYVQDESSQMAVLEMDIKKGEKILDLCAAPGGKTFFISWLTGETGSVTASDVNRYRLSKITDMIVERGLKNIEVALQDGAVRKQEWEETFDKVVVDAPCSSLGTIKRHPEIKWFRNSNDSTKMATLTARILDNAAHYVKKGGDLIFSVCTFTHEETVNQVSRFLDENHGYQLIRKYYTSEQFKDNRDNFFIAHFRREF